MQMRLDSLKPIALGAHELRAPFALAPMAGLSDVPLRTLAWRFGAGYLVSEMVSSKPELWDTGKSRSRRVPVPGARPVAIQIAGTDPDLMAEAARRHQDDGVEVIDINFGCPAKKVCRKAAGSALLGDLGRVARIIEAVANAVEVPVTAKTRTGLVPNDGIGVEFARAAERSGATMLTLHARSRACRFKGEVDYAAVRPIVESVKIPVLVNGDIDSRDRAEHALAASGARGVMIGRAAVGKPWLFAKLAGLAEPSLEDKLALVHEHLELMHAFYGEPAGVRIARKHLIAYANEFDVSERLSEVIRAETAAAQRAWVLGPFADAAADRALAAQSASVERAA